jgi:talin
MCLQNAAKQVASCTTQTMAAAQGSLSHNTNQVVHQHLLAECRTLGEHVPRLVEGVKGTMARPQDSETQLTLIEISETILQVWHQCVSCEITFFFNTICIIYLLLLFLQPGSRVVQASRAALPTVADQASAMALGQSSQQLSTALNDLRTATGRAREACGPGLELDSAERLIAELREELAAFEKAAQQAQLRPLPGDSVSCHTDPLISFGYILILRTIF